MYSETFTYKTGMLKILVYTWTKSYHIIISTVLFFYGFGLAQGRQSCRQLLQTFKNYGNTQKQLKCLNKFIALEH